ncbi:hypothetical protein PR048_005167 [Dryococelus australis]|uniref:Reverse transcriptase domain-containing protein n=1 Tax=Dryococelus australis TaxID=614101 RepID=A0ABQ9I7H1_9NEOP|nr:hypothetical protein PR048_005167 [Dryococelus australis]
MEVSEHNNVTLAWEEWNETYKTTKLYRKLFEKTITKRLQIIYLEKCTNIHAATRAAKYILKILNNNNTTMTSFMDIQKAFDMVHYTFLICKLIETGITTPYWKIIHSFPSWNTTRISTVVSDVSLYTRDTPRSEGATWPFIHMTQ